MEMQTVRKQDVREPSSQGERVRICLLEVLENSVTDAERDFDFFSGGVKLYVERQRFCFLADFIDDIVHNTN